MKKRILILNGPNLNLLGQRETDLYGNRPFEDYFDELKKSFNGVFLTYFQSNHEGVLIDVIQTAGSLFDGIVFNPGGYTHTSVALRDAVKSVTVPVAEVHITDIYAREAFRRVSLLEDVVKFRVTGKGLAGYREALEKLLAYFEK